MESLEFSSIDWQSEQYQLALDLRNRVLRIPLGLELSSLDAESEKEQLHFGAFLEGTLIGCVVAVVQSDGAAKLRQMAVDPAHERQGIGTFLLRQIEEELTQGDIRRVTLHARKSAIGFYEKLGYVAHGDEFVEVSIPHVVMQKELARQRGDATHK